MCFIIINNNYVCWVLNKEIIKKVVIVTVVVLALQQALKYVYYWPYLTIILAIIGFVRLVKGNRKYPNIQLSFISLFVVLSFTELYCRLDGKYITPSEKNGFGYVSLYSDNWNKTWYYVEPVYHYHAFKEKEFPVAWRSNNEGLKDKDFNIAKNDLRIMVFGDSFTEVIGADNDSSLPRQLSYLLADSFSSKTEVWNCGLAGSDPVYEFRLLRDKLLKYGPDMIIVVINSSDIQDVTIRGGFERFKADHSVSFHKGPWFEPIYARSFLARRIVHDAFRCDNQFILPCERESRKQEVYSELENAIDSFACLCREKQIKLILAFHPYQMTLDMKSPYLVMPMINYCVEKKLPYVDIKQELYRQGIDSSNARSLFWPEDRHCNNKGYYYFARSIYKRVIEELQN